MVSWNISVEEASRIQSQGVACYFIVVVAARTHACCLSFFKPEAVFERVGDHAEVTLASCSLDPRVCPSRKVLSLKNNGISACFVGGSADMRTEAKAMSGHFPLVFITPEKVIADLYTIERYLH